MDERPDLHSDAYETRMGRVKPAMAGRSLALPPFAPIVGVLGLALGLIVGFGLAPAAGPAPAPTPAWTAIAAPSPSGVPSFEPGRAVAEDRSTFELPPANGLTLAQALKALDAIRIAPVAPDVVWTRAGRWAEIWSAPAAPEDVWVWAITVRTESPFWCNRGPASESPGRLALQSPVVSCSQQTTEMFVLDYFTGDFLEAISPSPAWPG